MGPGRRRPGNPSVARLNRTQANAGIAPVTERHATRSARASSSSRDDQLAAEPAPWTVPGKWCPRGNWGRWGEQDKRGMLNFLTPDLIVKAAGLVKQGKVYALGEE